jgi:hypothetical protein
VNNRCVDMRLLILIIFKVTNKKYLATAPVTREHTCGVGTRGVGRNCNTLHNLRPSFVGKHVYKHFKNTAKPLYIWQTPCI